MAKLIRSTWVRDPAKHRDILLRAGEEPAPEYAALVTNPDAWEDGKLPSSVKSASESESSDGGDDSDTKQAAPKRAARKPATRGRASADEGDGGK